jgi:hypothetical protein
MMPEYVLVCGVLEVEVGEEREKEKRDGQNWETGGFLYFSGSNRPNTSQRARAQPLEACWLRLTR